MSEEKQPCTNCGEYEPTLVPVTAEQMAAHQPPNREELKQPELPPQFMIKGFIIKEPETVKPDGLNVEVIA